ncbi:MAG: hypothetical protein LBH59_02205 [Planctomycetaceae bacterium]|jgi:chromosome segregation ATPase|nr:hypothetical protein [Planctomycetaceae bacterium]
MKKRRNSPQTSLELFLDTICNTFGGILLIAILVAVQIRQTESNFEEHDAATPEEIMALQKKLDQLNADIKIAAALQATKQHSQPTTQLENEENEYSSYNHAQLTNAKINSTLKKAELTSLFTKQKNENLQLENQIKIIVTNIQTADKEVNDLAQQIKNQQSENLAQKQSNENTQNEIIALNKQITQYKNNPDTQTILNTRNETIYLPRLHESKTNQSVYLILRFKRVYDASVRADFDSPSNEQLGMPKMNRGLPIDTSDKFKNEVKKLLQKYNPKNVYASVIVYGDSADLFYVVRNILVESGFEYDLKPSGENSTWKFTTGSGSNDVQ